MRLTSLLAVGVFLGAVSTAAAADTEPSYTKDVKPFMAKYCVDCHGAGKPKAGLDVSTYEDLIKGGKKKAIVAGKPDDSLLVKTLDGSAKKMPPKKAEKQPTEKEIEVIKAWIKAGAKDDSADTKGEKKEKSELPAEQRPNSSRADVGVTPRREVEASPHD